MKSYRTFAVTKQLSKFNKMEKLSVFITKSQMKKLIMFLSQILISLENYRKSTGRILKTKINKSLNIRFAKVVPAVKSAILKG